jgi:hypothetical protein
VQNSPGAGASVDDWWRVVGDFEASKHLTGAQIIPMAGVYGGPQDQVVTDDDEDGAPDNFGVDFSVWALPGVFDEVTLVSGDDNQSVGGDLGVHWAMKSNNQRLWDDTDNNGVGDSDPFDLEHYTHFFALNSQVNDSFPPSEDLEVRQADFRGFTRLLCFPSNEMPDQPDAMEGPFIGRSIGGESTACTVDEILGDERNTLFDLTLKEEVSASDETIKLTSEEGTPNEDDLPDGPGMLRIGDEMIVWDEVGVEGDAMVFSGCVRGTQLSDPSAYPVGTLVEPLFGIYVGLLTSAVNAQTNVMEVKGIDTFPPIGCVRLEDPEAGDAELRIYTRNKVTSLQMPIAEGVGSGLFLGRYGSIARAFGTGSPVFWQPVRTWDRHSEFADNPEIGFFGLSHRFTDAYVKRVWWKQGQMPEHTMVRLVVRVNESVPWNAKADDVLFLSRAGARTGDTVPQKFQTRMSEAGNSAKFLRAMEQPAADNLLGIDKGVQADIIEIRIFTIYKKGAWQWTVPSANGWKQSPIIQGVGIEYVQQNSTRAHKDR